MPFSNNRIVKLFVGGLIAPVLSWSQQARPLKEGIWHAELIRQDSIPVVFNLSVRDWNGTRKIAVLNATEAIEVINIVHQADSLNFAMPVFESEFKTRIQDDGSLKGIWIKGTAGKTQHWPFFAYPGKTYRFRPDEEKAAANITGTWSVSFTRSNNTMRFAIAEFFQHGNDVTGTFLTPNGDYRYLQGVVSGDSLKLSTFDGAHAYVFKARIADASHLTGGMFYSGIAGREKWSAEKDNKAILSKESSAVYVKEGREKLRFRFPDLDSNLVSIEDDRFRNKVLVIQLMGSWCPNCMDETKFLSDFYDKNRGREIEILGLAYEYSTDFHRSQKSLRKFQQRFHVNYPMLITPVGVNDSLRTEKTLPNITPIKSFPTTIFADRRGRIRKIHTGFYGPGTGKYFEELKKEFESTIEELLIEK